MAGDPPDDGPPGRLRPTVIDPAAGRRRARAAGATPPSPPARSARGRQEAAAPGVVTVPTSVPGVQRERIAVTVADIERLSPGLAPSVAARAVRLVEEFVVEGARDRHVTLWGHAAQRDYADVVSRTLELSQADVLIRARGYVGRIIGILGAIDLEAVCGIGQAAGIFGRILRSAGPRIDTPPELEAARLELDQLVKLTGAAIEPLLKLKDALEQQSRHIEAAGREIEAAAMGAAFLSGYLEAGQPALSRRFLERSMSLAQSALQIRGGEPLHATQVDEPLRLIAAIQDAVLVSMPGWLGAIASLTTAANTARRPTPTEAGELQHQLRTILQQLKA